MTSVETKAGEMAKEFGEGSPVLLPLGVWERGQGSRAGAFRVFGENLLRREKWVVYLKRIEKSQVSGMIQCDNIKLKGSVNDEAVRGKT